MENPVPPLQTTQKPSLSLGRLIGLAGAALLAIGAFLPWGKIMGIIEAKGIDGDGKITLGIGIIAIILLLIKKAPLWISLILGVVALAIGGYDFYAMTTVDKELGLELAELAELAKVTVGSGLYLTVLGGLALTVGPIVGYVQGKKE